MKFSALLLSSLFCLPVAAADLQSVHSVYLLSMSGGLDQALASRLTEARLLQVVADPKRADAVLTDRLGPEFESRMAELYPEAAESGKAKEDAEAKAKKEAERPIGPSSFGRGRGTVFLVGVKERAVVWSAYERPADSSARSIDRAARRIVERLKRDLAPRKK